MISLPLSESTIDTLRRFGLMLDDNLMWWGSFPALQRADDQFGIFDSERRDRLNVLSRIGCESPSDLKPRDRAFYMGLAAEVAAAIELQPAGAP